jgi:GGDEF domain-containing protein
LRGKSIGPRRSSNNRESSISTLRSISIHKRSVAYVKRCGTSAALVYLDIDGFKPFNDRHGPAAEDVVPKTVHAPAGVLVRAAAAMDTRKNLTQ